MTAADEYLLRLESVHKRYPVRPEAGERAANGRREKTVLHDVDLRVRKGELVTVVGPSGCGKSTMLRLILGSEKPSAGRSTARAATAASSIRSTRSSPT